MLALCYNASAAGWLELHDLHTAAEVLPKKRLHVSRIGDQELWVSIDFDKKNEEEGRIEMVIHGRKNRN